MKVVLVRSTPIDPDVRVEKEAQSLGKQNNDVCILGWNRELKEYPNPEHRDIYLIRRINLKAKYGIKILASLPIWWALEFKHLMNMKWDVVHAADFDTYVPALLSAKLKHKKIIYDIYDTYADSIKLPTLMRNLFVYIDKLLMKFSDAVILADKSRVEEIGITKTSNLHIIYNVPNEDEIKYVKAIPQNINDKRYHIFYAGTFTPYRDVQSIAQIANECNDITLELAGPLTQSDLPKTLSRDYNNVKYIGILTPEESLYRSINSDLLFALYDPNLLANKYASPNKLFDAMMGGIPIIVSNGTTMADIVRKEKCGIVVEYGNYKQIKDAVLLLKNNPDYAKELGENGRKAFEREYNWNIMEKRLYDIYLNL